MLTFIFTLLLTWMQSGNLESAKLEKMVAEREILHNQWKESESKKSGIFGNRTKKDMIETNEWLERILAKDNQIMDELKMIGAIKTTVISQEKEDYKTITQSLEQDVQALRRALAERDQQMEEMLASRRTFEWTTTIFFLITLGLGYWIFRLKRGK